MRFWICSLPSRRQREGDGDVWFTRHVLASPAAQTSDATRGRLNSCIVPELSPSQVFSLMICLMHKKRHERLNFGYKLPQV